MRRRQLIEIEDQPWCPRVVRDGGTDWLAFMANTSGMFDAAAPILREAMQRTGTNEILDLCSGGGGPWLRLERQLSRAGDVQVTLSDLYPNVPALEEARRRSGGRLRFSAESVDATDVPASREGVRTMFNAFHHFPPDVARRILADAVAKRRGIAIFEGARTRLIAPLVMPLQLPFILLLTPFVRPFHWRRLLFTYAVPLIPALVLFDGVMSFMRLYLEDDLRALLATVPGHETYEWRIGETPIKGAPVGGLHLVGFPKRPNG